MNSPQRASYRVRVSENTRVLTSCSPSSRQINAILRPSRQVHNTLLYYSRTCLHGANFPDFA